MLDKIIFLIVTVFILDCLAQGSIPCYDGFGRAQQCAPPFENVAFYKTIESTNTCGLNGSSDYCLQVGRQEGNERDTCRKCDDSILELSHSPRFLTDFINNDNITWWQSETLLEGIQYPNSVNLTLKLGKEFDITYVRLTFKSSRPESMAIYKRMHDGGPWIPYQYFSASCYETYNLQQDETITADDETKAICTDEYSDIIPFSGANVAFSTLQGRPGASNFDANIVLQDWITATDIKIVLSRVNTYGDEVFNNDKVLQSYFYAMSDFSVGGRCKCNGHASECTDSTGQGQEVEYLCNCEHNTAGRNCELCKPLYNNQPWRRANSEDAYECQECNCNSHSHRCHFDAAVYEVTGQVSGGVCDDCQHSTQGKNCEECLPGFYRDPSLPLTDPNVCKQANDDIANQFLDYTPSYGPKAGGTNITLKGLFSNWQILSAELKSKPSDPRNDISLFFDLVTPLKDDSPANAIIIKTPPAIIQSGSTVDIVGQELEIHLNINIVKGPNQELEFQTVNTGFVFVYRGNPEISGIKPNNVFLRGGIPVTASGNNLDSVYAPVMFIFMEKREFDSRDNSFYVTDTVAFRSLNTYVVNSTTVVGIMPHIDLNATSNTQSSLNRTQGFTRNRRQTRVLSTTVTPVVDSTRPINSETLQFFVGFQMDGSKKWLNLSQAIAPEETVSVFANPIIHKFPDLRMFDPKTETVIDILGKDLALGADITSYTVTIGQGECRVIELLSNVINCVPPENEPEDESGPRNIPGKPTVKVSVGYLTFHVGHMDYVDDDTTRYIIIGLVLGAVILIALIAVTVGIACRRTSKSYDSVPMSAR